MSNIIRLVRRPEHHIMLDVPPDISIPTILHALYNVGYYLKSDSDNAVYTIAKLTPEHKRVPK